MSVDALLKSLLAAPWGQVSPSTYETARLVVLAPWLTGHAERVDHLLRTQRADGGWGGPEGYGLVATLSATDALLAEAAAGPGMAAAAADHGLARLHRGYGPASALPDLPATDIIVPVLTESINARPAAEGRPALELPRGMRRDRPAAVRSLLARREPVDAKLAHALEVGGPAAHGSSAVQLAVTGSIGASAAATAAWLGPTAPVAGHPARRFLETVVMRHHSLAPCAMPVTVFERAWVLSSLARVGLSPLVPPAMLADLRAAVTGSAAATAPGLPGDADTTSAVLYALARLDGPGPVDPLWTFEGSDHFHTWPGEQGASSSVNAHVLEALGVNVPGPRERLAMVRVTRWLLDQQRPEGSWDDRWHASPYYATACCAVALRLFGGAPARAAVRRAVAWVVASQRADGSWGRWTGTAEETAYAVQTLLLAAGAGYPSIDSSLSRSQAHLIGEFLIDPAGEMRMWHDKDLYQPRAVVRAAILAARHLLRSRPVAPIVRQNDSERLSGATQRC